MLSIKPPNIYCLGRTYAKHASELGNPVPSEPVVFMKSTSSLRSLEWGGSYPGSLVKSGLHYEAEIVLQVGSSTSEPGMGKIQNAALGLDLTDRQKQTELKTAGLPWVLAKSFAGAAIVSPWTDVSSLPASDTWSFELSLDGKNVQAGSVGQMLFSLPFMIDFLHKSFGLLEGDYIFTGTPPGVGPCRPGQKFTLEGLGSLSFSGVL